MLKAVPVKPCVLINTRELLTFVLKMSHITHICEFLLSIWGCKMHFGTIAILYDFKQKRYENSNLLVQ